MDKCFSRNLVSLWPPSGVGKWRRKKSREWLDAEKNARAHVKFVTETMLGGPLSFVVEGNSYVATQGYLLSPQLAASI